MYQYKLTEITFNDGTVVTPGTLNVIVGPNNSGKSRALKEIVRKTTTTAQSTDVVVSNVKWTLPNSIDELRAAYDVERYSNETGGWDYRVLRPELIEEQGFGTGTSWPDGFQTQIAGQTDWFSFFAQHFGNAMMAFLTTEYRLQLVKESPSPSHERQTANLLQGLYNAGRSAEQTIRGLVKREFGKEVALDFAVLQRLLLRVGEDFSSLPADPREAKAHLLQHEKLDDQGDGIRSFVGIVVAMLSLKRSLFLIDEPEAFLHPPQAFRIGEFLAAQASVGRQIILATHSADVLRGILSKTRDVSIIRIDRNGNTNSFKLLDSDRVNEIVVDPLLGSARVLDGLFYSGAIVVEADADARFYNAVSNKRLPQTNFHFVNADNKQTVPRITTMYRNMGVRSAGIVDFDVLNDRVEFERQLDAIGVVTSEKNDALSVQREIADFVAQTPRDQRLQSAKQQLEDLVAAVGIVEHERFASMGDETAAKDRLLRQINNKCRELANSTRVWTDLKRNGRSALTPGLQSRFDSLWAICASKGLFINPLGELESMLVDYGIPSTTDKRAWITQALQLIPSLEVDDNKYPWKLIASIHQLLTN